MKLCAENWFLLGHSLTPCKTEAVHMYQKSCSDLCCPYKQHVGILVLAFPISWMIFTTEVNWLSLIINYKMKNAHNDETINITIIPES